MTTREFDGIFKPMVSALGCKMNPQQAALYFDEYGTTNRDDFTHACRELSMGNAGYMPKPEVFRDYVAAAREMRVHQESAHRDKLAQNILHRGGVSQGPMDDLFARCCAKRILAESKEAVPFIEEALRNHEFVAWLSSWRTEAGEVALVWLQGQLASKRTNTGVTMPRAHDAR